MTGTLVTTISTLLPSPPLGDSMSSEDEFPFTEDEEDEVINGTSVDHYESLVSE